jgi:hypothetical protein
MLDPLRYLDLQEARQPPFDEGWDRRWYEVHVIPLFTELREKRDLIRELVDEEGCPPRKSDDGGQVCAFCDGPMIDGAGEPQFKHADECIWLRIVATRR